MKVWILMDDSDYYGPDLYDGDYNREDEPKVFRSKEEGEAFIGRHQRRGFRLILVEANLV